MAMLKEGEEVCQNLTRMKLIGQAIDHGDSGVVGKSG
jgi:hypothetical protein